MNTSVEAACGIVLILAALVAPSSEEAQNYLEALPANQG